MAIFAVALNATVTQYPYRTASVQDPFLTLRRGALLELEEQLAYAAGTQTDNHTVYMISQGGNVTYIMFTDMSVHFAHTVNEARW